MKMLIKPLFDRVLVERAPMQEEGKSVGGIIMPNVSQVVPTYGTVIATGQGGRTEDGKFIPMTVKVGEVVMFSKYTGTPVDEATFGPDILVMRESEILGTIEKES